MRATCRGWLKRRVFVFLPAGVSPRIHSGIASLRTCSSGEPTYGLSRTCWGMPVWQRRRNTRTSRSNTFGRNTKKRIPRQKAAVDTHKIGLVQWWFVFTGEDTTMYAVIRSGGKQYRVSPGQTIRLEKFAGDVGSKVEIKDVLLVENDGSIQLGTPAIANVTVEGTVIEQDRMKKIIVFKKKRKKQYRRTQGHRQDYTAVRIDKITV